jgi:dynein heavy chain, axonemal
LTSKFKEFAQSDNPHRKWLIFDGPIDAIWVEGMNTLLDDNKKLCLNSGEVIKMSKTMNIIFEDRNCAVVSPATVSRCGTVFLEPKALGWKVLLESWLNKLPTYLSQDEKIYVRDLILWVGDYLLFFIRKNI